MADQSPYLLAALQAMKGGAPQTAQPVTPQLAQQYAQAAHARQQQSTLQSLGADQTLLPPMVDANGMPSVPASTMTPQQPGYEQQQGQPSPFGGLFGLGQKLKGLFSGGN